MKQLFEFLTIVSTILVAIGEILKQINKLRDSMDKAVANSGARSAKKKKEEENTGK